MPDVTIRGSAVVDAACTALLRWLEGNGMTEAAAKVRLASSTQLTGYEAELPGPVGERNLYALHPRGHVLLVPATEDGLAVQLGTALAGGNRATIVWPGEMPARFSQLPSIVADRIAWLRDVPANSTFAAVLIEPRMDGLRAVNLQLAGMAGPIPIIQVADGDGHYRPDWLVEEVSTSINTTAAGGNATLMAMV